MSGFHKYRLRDLISLQRGYDLTETERQSGKVPIVGSAGVHGYHNQARAKGPGITIGRSGGSFGKVTFIREDFWPHNTTIFVTDFKGNDPLFIRYLLETVDFSLLNSGSAQQSLNRNFVYRIPIKEFSRGQQRKIAAILSAYDELIESNKRRIALLEKLAGEIYREWFVRLRFPSHENTKLIRGVPRGWHVAELRELATINPSSISRRDKPERILYIDISSVSTNRIEEVTAYEGSEAPGRARRRVKHGDIIWSSVRPANRAYCLIYEPPENLIVSTGFAVIRPHASTPFTFLNFAVTSHAFVDQMTVVARGAAYPATSFEDFEKAKVLVPSATLLETFHETTEPLFRQRHVLSLQRDYLTATRDILLPRLISGKLSVENLDIHFPPGMVEELDQNLDDSHHA